MGNYIVYNQAIEADNSTVMWDLTKNADNIQKNEISVQERKIQKKIKPIQNPALKLKTPIAYQRDSDPNILPIEKEGRGKNILIYISYNLWLCKYAHDLLADFLII